MKERKFDFGGWATRNDLLCAVNFSPNAYENYRVGVPARKRYVPVFNTDDAAFGGSGFGNDKAVPVEKLPSHGREQSVSIRIPPFGGVFFKSWGKIAAKKDEAPQPENPVKKRTAKNTQ